MYQTVLFGTDEFLRLSLGRLGRHNFLQKEMELQIYSSEMLTISSEAVPLNCSSQAAQKK